MMHSTQTPGDLLLTWKDIIKLSLRYSSWEAAYDIINTVCPDNYSDLEYYLERHEDKGKLRENLSGQSKLMRKIADDVMIRGQIMADLVIQERNSSLVDEILALHHKNVQVMEYGQVRVHEGNWRKVVRRMVRRAGR